MHTIFIKEIKKLLCIHCIEQGQIQGKKRFIKVLTTILWLKFDLLTLNMTLALQVICNTNTLSNLEYQKTPS